MVRPVPLGRLGLLRRRSLPFLRPVEPFSSGQVLRGRSFSRPVKSQSARPAVPVPVTPAGLAHAFTMLFSARLWGLTGVCQTHESKNVGVRVRGTGFGIEHGVLLGTATGIGCGREGDARSRNRCAQGQ